VDPTNAALLGGLAGVVIGSMSVFAVRASEKSEVRMTQVPVAPRIPPGASAVLAVLRSSALVLDTAERVVNTSPSAVAMGLVDEDRLVQPQLLELVRQVHRDGEIRETELSIGAGRGRPPAWLHVRAAPLMDAHVLLLVDDRTSAHRVEEVRRDSEAVERFASRMQLESARLGKLIKEIVDLSRLQASDALQEPKRVRLAEVIREAVDLSLVEADAKQIRIVQRADPAAIAYGDHGLLVTAVRNLIGNAIAYSPAQTEVGVGAQVSAEGVTITVADRGLGIPVAEQERIFERFYRVDSARSRSTGGTGLGLAIVKHICANHGGSVTVWSREGEGSTFTIRLPHPPASASTSAEGSAA